MPGILEKRINGKERLSKEEIHELDMEYENLTDEDIEELNEMDALMEDEEFEKEQKLSKLAKRSFAILLSVGCIYLVTLIYGVVITEYEFKDNGQIGPVVMDVSELMARDQFNEILGIYLESRNIYEELLTLDYRLSSGVEDMVAVATEYEGVLHKTATLVTQIEALHADSRYMELMNLIYTWNSREVEVYCQNIEAAVIQNNEEASAEALSGREYLVSEFNQITSVIVTLGESIKGIDLTDVKNWSPDSIASSIMGM